MNFKIFRLITIVSTILITTFVEATPVVTTLNQASGNITVTTGYINEIDLTWNINTGINKPIRLNCNIDTEQNFDFITITPLGSDGNPIEPPTLYISGAFTGSISTIVPTGRVRIQFTSDESVCYSSTGYSGITISFDVDYGFSTNENSYTSGNAIVSGNVGIGITRPDSKLVIMEGTNAVSVNSAALGFNRNVRQGTIFNTSRSAWQFTARDERFSLEGYNGAFANLFNVLKNGDVGIGTYSPLAKLHVFGKQMIGTGTQPLISGNSTLQIQQNSNTETSLNLWQYGVANAIIGSKPNDAKFYITNNYSGEGLGAANHSITLDTDGKVGIGTTTPGFKLDVAGNARVTNDLYISGSGPDIGGSLNILNAAKTSPGQASKWTIYNMSGSYGNSLQFWAYDNIGCTSGGVCNNRFTIMDNGNVGIGTSPANINDKLTVNGTIHASEVKVDLNNLADYVFKPSYKLMSLPEVEQFVKTNSHLPEIPSAAEVQKNGMSIGEMQNKLLQKIEELTLYVIEQQKQIDELKRK